MRRRLSRYGATHSSVGRCRSNWLGTDILPAFAARPGLCGAHLLVGDQEVSQIKTQEQELRGGPDAVADWVILVEGYDHTGCEEALAVLTGLTGLAAHGAGENLITNFLASTTCLTKRKQRIWKRGSSCV